jgi:pilus assembly protein Flp/PilA
MPSRSVPESDKKLNRLRRFLARDDAATMVEYALMLSLIALICFTAVALVGTGTNSVFGSTTILDAL